MNDRAAWPGIIGFFAATFAITWTLQLPSVLSHLGVIAGEEDRYMGLAMLGVLGPALAAIVVTGLQAGVSGVRGLLQPLRLWRAGPLSYLVALGLPGGILAAGMAIYGAFGGTGSWVYPPQTGTAIVAATIISLGEEIGWRGFALPRLQSRYGPLLASVIIGVLWTLWHIPMFIGLDVPSSLLPVMVLFFVPGSVVFTWIYNRTGGSLVLVVLAHVGAHLNNSHQPLPGKSPSICRGFSSSLIP